jgi:hypothetical protein
MVFGAGFSDEVVVQALAGDTVGVYYAYTPVSPDIDHTTIAYIYSGGGILSDEVIGYRAAATQKIMNNFPQWMEMRQQHDSEGQKLVHSWGRHLEDTTNLYSEYRSEEFLETADQYDDVDLGIAELSFEEERVYEPEFRNLLFNSSFNMAAADRYQRPEGWTVRRDNLDTVSLVKEASLFGNQGILLDGINGGAEIKQSRNITLAAGRLNASVYVKVISNQEDIGSCPECDTDDLVTAIYPAGDAGLILVLNYADGTTKSFGVGFPNHTDGGWVRASFSSPVEKELHKFEFIIVNRIVAKFYIDLPQLEINGKASAWTPGISDMPIHSDERTRSVSAVQVLLGTPETQAVDKIELFPLGTEDEFKTVRVPTRVEPFSPPDNPLTTINDSFGRQINYLGETMPTVWQTFNGVIREKALRSEDKFGDVLPADLYMDEDGGRFIDRSAIDASTTTVKATTVYKGWLLAVTEESYGGKTDHYLKITKPVKVQYEDDFVQSYGDIRLKLNLGTSFGLNSISENINRLGICKNIPNAIFIDTDLNRRFYLKLRFDYFYADFASRKVFTRENYSAQNGHLQVM